MLYSYEEWLEEYSEDIQNMYNIFSKVFNKSYDEFSVFLYNEYILTMKN